MALLRFGLHQLSGQSFHRCAPSCFLHGAEPPLALLLLFPLLELVLSFSTSVAAAIAGDIVLSLEKGSDFATELDSLVGVVQIFAALVIETKAGGMLEAIWDDSLCHFPDREFADFFAKKVEIFIDLE